jgi:hypothetical protein
MEEYIKWLENKIEVCLEDKDLKREHWAFCQALKKYRELALRQFSVVGRSEKLEAKRKNFCLWYYAQSQPLDANKIADWFASN